MYENQLVDKAKYEKELNSRWSWITEDIEDAELKLNTQLVLENSYKKMVSEKSVPQGWLATSLAEMKQENGETLTEEENRLLTEAPQVSGSVGDYVIPKVMFPVIRRVMPELIANKLVSVQPLSQPTGVIYYLTYQYSNSKGEVNAGDEFSANPQQTSPAYSTWYSSEKIPYTAQKITTVADTDFTGNAEKTVAFLGTDTTGFSFKRIEIIDTTTGKNIIVKKDAIEVGTTAITFDDYASYAIDTGIVTVKAAALTALGLDGTTENTVKIFLVYDQEATSKIPEMEFGIDNMNVSTTERKLKVRWTKEAEQDMMAYHKINVEQELVKVAAIQTNYEIDREVINFIDDLVISPLQMSHNWTADAAVSGNNTQGNYLDRHRALAQKLYMATTKIAEYNHIAPGDWGVLSPRMAAVLQMLPDWKSGEISNNKSTFYNAGSLGNGTMTLYVDPNRTGAQASDITIGYKAKDTTYGAGVVYSPYANWMSNTVVNPDNFNNIRGTFSRYAITATPRSEFNYARVTVDNLVDTTY